MRRLKNSVGIWAFGPNATRFVPGGYHPEAVAESVEERLQRAVDGLGNLIDGFEFHYPHELNEGNLQRIQKILGDKDIYLIGPGLFMEPKFAHGCFINPNKQLRQESMRILKAGIDLAAEVGAWFNIWPGNEGYNYPIQVYYDDVWNLFIDGLQEAVEYCNSRGVRFMLEHKNSEPAMQILMRNLGTTMWLIYKLRELGTDTTNVKINMDWQHLIMNNEPLAEYAALLAKENLLGHHHGNSGWGTFDDDNMVGASFFVQTLGLAIELRRLGYGKNGERVGFDLFPYTEDQVAAVKRSILQWEFIDTIAGKIDTTALQQAQHNKDAVRCYELVYKALGLDEDFIKSVSA